MSEKEKDKLIVQPDWHFSRLNDQDGYTDYQFVNVKNQKSNKVLY